MQQAEQIQKLMETLGPVAIFGVVGGVLVIFLIIAILICLFLSSCLKRIPEEHRQQSPGMVWLLLIPCFAVVWNFFVYPKIAESFA
jgi:hypothetical protein